MTENDKLLKVYDSVDVYHRAGNTLDVQAYGRDSDQVTFLCTDNLDGVVLTLADTKAMIEQLQYIVNRYEELNPQPSNVEILDALGTGAVMVINNESIPWVKLPSGEWTCDGHGVSPSYVFDTDFYKVNVLSEGLK
jgi:hypothetical protein